jgi:hypothetical protein
MALPESCITTLYTLELMPSTDGSPTIPSLPIMPTSTLAPLSVTATREAIPPARK